MHLEEALVLAVTGLTGAVIYLFKMIEDRAKQCERELEQIYDKYEDLAKVSFCRSYQCSKRDNPHDG